MESSRKDETPQIDLYVDGGTFHSGNPYDSDAEGYRKWGADAQKLASV